MFPPKSFDTPPPLIILRGCSEGLRRSTFVSRCVYIFVQVVEVVSKLNEERESIHESLVRVWYLEGNLYLKQVRMRPAVSIETVPASDGDTGLEEIMNASKPSKHVKRLG